MIHLYLDPGSGSNLKQVIISVLTAISLAIATQWRRIKRLFKKDDKNDEE